MTDGYVKYRKGYKYQLAENYRVQTTITPAVNIDTRFISLTTDGVLTVLTGYAWDGASGPTWDDETNMRGSLGHDALYQLIRRGYLPTECKAEADELLRKWCIEDGMWSLRADGWFWAVDRFGASSADPNHRRPVLVAPKKINQSALQGV